MSSLPDVATASAPPTVATRVLRALLRFGPALAAVALAAAAYFAGLLDYISLSQLSHRRDLLEAYVAAHPVLSVLGFIGVFAAGVTLSLPVALVLMLSGGFLFGAFEGGLAAAAASTLGGTATYLICRTAAGDVVMRFAGRRVARFQLKAQEDAFILLLGLRLVPMMPFWMINVGAGALRVPLRSFLGATALGVLPSSFIYSVLGSGLGRMFDAGAKPSLAMVLQPPVYLPLIGLAVLALLPVGWRIARARGAPAAPA